MTTGYSPVEGRGKQRTDMHCHNCSKGFVAELDYDINGNHVVECPRCGHEHCRTIVNGKITDDRWDGRTQRVQVDTRSVWTSDVLAARTSVASEFIRARWLNLGGSLDFSQ